MKYGTLFIHLCEALMHNKQFRCIFRLGLCLLFPEPTPEPEPEEDPLDVEERELNSKLMLSLTLTLVDEENLRQRLLEIRFAR